MYFQRKQTDIYHREIFIQTGIFILVPLDLFRYQLIWNEWNPLDRLLCFYATTLNFCTDNWRIKIINSLIIREFVEELILI